MIALSTPDFDLQGSVVIKEHLDNPYQAQRRGSVTPTLDADSVTYDTGYSVSDQTMTALVRNPSRDLSRQLQYLVAYYPELILCAENGCFRVRVSFQSDRGDLNLQLRLLRRLDE